MLLLELRFLTNVHSPSFENDFRVRCSYALAGCSFRDRSCRIWPPAGNSRKYRVAAKSQVEQRNRVLFHLSPRCPEMSRVVLCCPLPEGSISHIKIMWSRSLSFARRSGGQNAAAIFLAVTGIIHLDRQAVPVLDYNKSTHISSQLKFEGEGAHECIPRSWLSLCARN